MFSLAKQQRRVVTACYLGWTLDAFDFFIMAFALEDIAKEFGTTRTAVSWAFTLTLAMRPFGALLFGRLADKYGRRPTLMANVLIYSILEFASGFAPTLSVFFILRALYGVAMGGEWGVGASLTMESIPKRWRGSVSGVLQAGYPSGYLLATLLYRVSYTSVGWRGMFMIGVLPALLVLYIRRNVPESPDWVARETKAYRPSFFKIVWRHRGLTLYAIATMAAFNFFSHGTQDLYPSFLAHERHFPLHTQSTILAVMNVAAIIGGLTFASLSQQLGRRRMIVAAALLSLTALPLWAFSTTPILVGIGAFLMQLFVQGAWGVIPAHLNELSPPEARATFPGLTYQLGNLIAAANAPLQSKVADSVFGGDLSWVMAGVAGTTAIVIAVLVSYGKEAREVEMRQLPLERAT